MEDANVGWDACLADLDQAQAGLLEIQRLIALPPGHRHSDFTCSGQLCPGILESIEMLVSAPRQNIRRGRGGGRR